MTSSPVLLVLLAYRLYPSWAVSAPLMRRSVDVSPGGAQHLTKTDEPEEKSKDLQSSLLEVEDVERIMKKAGVHEDVFDVKAFDRNGDGHLSRDELTGLGAAANLKGVASKLVQQLPQQAEKKYKEDIALFKKADVDGSSLLEAGEVDALLAQTPLAPGSFDWHKYDFDGNGALSQGEFLAAGDAVLQQVKHQHQVALEAQQQASLLEQEAISSEMQVFNDADKNHDGFLEQSEMDALNGRAGLTGFDWKVFDSDKDNRLNETEFLKSGPVAAAFGHARREERLLKRTQEGDEADRKIFQQADTNGNSLLEKHEVESLLHKVNISPHLFNWHDFDHDHDGKLSQEEFLEGGPAAFKSSLQGPSSFVEESGSEDDAEGVPSYLKDDFVVWAETDKDHSGYLDANEIHQLMKEADIKDIDWKVYDTDHDGRLSSEEFQRAADDLKEKASPQFRHKIQEALGEDTEGK